MKATKSKKLSYLVYQSVAYYSQDSIDEMIDDIKVEYSEDELDENKIWDIIYQENNQWLEDELQNISYCTEAMQPCFIMGKVGTWQGKFEIKPKICGNLVLAIKMICQLNSDYHLQIRFENGIVYVEQPHQDNTNSFTIQPLNARGLRLSPSTYNVNAENVGKYIKKYKEIM